MTAPVKRLTNASSYFVQQPITENHRRDLESSSRSSLISVGGAAGKVESKSFFQVAIDGLVWLFHCLTCGIFSQKKKKETEKEQQAVPNFNQQMQRQMDQVKERERVREFEVEKQWEAHFKADNEAWEKQYDGFLPYFKKFVGTKSIPPEAVRQLNELCLDVDARKSRWEKIVRDLRQIVSERPGAGDSVRTEIETVFEKLKEIYTKEKSTQDKNEKVAELRNGIKDKKMLQLFDASCLLVKLDHLHAAAEFFRDN